MKVSGIILTNGLVVPCFFEKLEKQEISLGARCTYGVLAKLSWKSDRCWPSQKYLAERLGVSIRSIQKYLRELARLGFIAILSGHDGETNTYQLLPHPLVVAELEVRAARTSVTPEKSSGGHGEKISPVFKKEEKKNTPLTPQRGEEGNRPSQSTQAWKPEAIAAFDRIWAVWPVQEARTMALRWWLRLWRLRSLPSLDAILASVRSHIAQNPRWKRGFVPFLATWLKGRRWEDPMPTEPSCSVNASHPTPKPESAKPLGLQGEKANSKPAAQLPDNVWQRLERALSLWPSALTDAESRRVRGLWMYLYYKNKLPSDSLIAKAARNTNQKFSRWLHVYQQKEHGDTSKVFQETWCCAY
ncbi:MAG: helix-turn-helix domain-containing protein [Desulfovibrio sp.]